MPAMRASFRVPGLEVHPHRPVPFLPKDRAEATCIVVRDEHGSQPGCQFQLRAEKGLGALPGKTTRRARASARAFSRSNLAQTLTPGAGTAGHKILPAAGPGIDSGTEI